MADDIIKSAIESYVNRLSTSEKDISVLQKESEIQGRIFLKFETTIEKIQDLTESMHRLISIHDERLKFQERIAEELKVTATNAALRLSETAVNTAKDLEKETQSVRTEMKNEMKELENRLTNKLEDTETRILEKIEELKSDQKTAKTTSQETKDEEKDRFTSLLIKFSSWKWFIAGGLVVAGVILGKTSLISSILSVL